MNQKFQALLLKVRKAVRGRVKESPKPVTPEQADVAHAHGHHNIDLSKPNISRFFVEQRHITWVCLLYTSPSPRDS